MRRSLSSTSASTESSQQVEVRARVNGFLDDRLYTEGSIVQKGDGDVPHGCQTLRGTA